MAYASKYYDPVKAHAYYERTKELKGRSSSTKGMTKSERSTAAVVKDSISKSKKVETESGRSASKAAIDRIRNVAKMRSEAIRQRLAALTESTKKERESQSADRKASAEKLTADLKAKIEALPKSLSKTERAAKVAALRAEVTNDRKKLSEDSNAKREATTANVKRERDTAKAERDDIRAFSKAAIDKARADWKAKSEQIKQKYESELSREIENIKRSS